MYHEMDVGGIFRKMKIALKLAFSSLCSRLFQSLLILMVAMFDGFDFMMLLNYGRYGGE